MANVYICQKYNVGQRSQSSSRAQNVCYHRKGLVTVLGTLMSYIKALSVTVKNYIHC